MEPLMQLLTCNPASLSASHCIASKPLQSSWQCDSRWGLVSVMQLLSSGPQRYPCGLESPPKMKFKWAISLRGIGDLVFFIE